MKRFGIALGIIVVLTILAFIGRQTWKKHQEKPALYAFTAAISTGMQPAMGNPIKLMSGLQHVPSGIAIDARDDVYLVDSAANTIVKLTAEGKLLTDWGNFGPGRGQHQESAEIAVSKTGTVFVKDNQNQRIVKFASNGGFQGAWCPLPAGAQYAKQDVRPSAMALDERGNLFLAFRLPSRTLLCKFDDTGKSLTQWELDSSVGRLGALAVDPQGAMYAADSDAHRLVKFDNAGKLVRQWGRQGADQGEFNAPDGLCVDPLGNVYVADSNNKRIQKFSANGELITVWSDQLTDPSHLAVDSLGNVYAVDPSSQRVLKYRQIVPAK